MISPLPDAVTRVVTTVKLIPAGPLHTTRGSLEGPSRLQKPGARRFSLGPSPRPALLTEAERHRGVPNHDVQATAMSGWRYAPPPRRA